MQSTCSPTRGLPEAASGSSHASSESTPPRDQVIAMRERKGGLACAECRRSKLKCDRTVPCQACVRRGCALLCPNGAMNATKGNKALQCHAQKLAQQVTNMSAKIKELENALAAAHLHAGLDLPGGDQDRDPHHHYNERRRSYEESPGSLAMDQDGLSRYYGDMAASEYLSGLIPGTGMSPMHHFPDLHQLGLPTEVLELFNAFPFGLRDRPHTKSYFLPFIPARDRALKLTEYYYQSFGTFNPITRRDFMKEVLDRMYDFGEIPNLDRLHPHRLAIFFGVMAIGASRSFEIAAAAQAERYYVLACATLSLAPIIAEAMCATIQALYVINSFLFIMARASSEESWLIVGLCGRLAYRIGLHRDGTRFNLDEDEVQRRRVLFWELYTWDAWLSFVTGRAPCIHLLYTDTKFPEDEHDSGIIGYHSWKYRHAAGCLWPTVRAASTSEAMPYDTIMELDRKIRGFPVPVQIQPQLHGFTERAWSNDPASACQQMCHICVRELNLLFLHRNYLAYALNSLISEGQDPLTHKFAGSVVAAHRSASRITMALRDVYQIHADVVSHVGVFWAALFSSCINFAAIVVVAPGCRLSHSCFSDLKVACAMFEEGSRPCLDPKAMRILGDLQRRAELCYSTYWNHGPADHSMRSTVRLVAGKLDELRVLGCLEVLIPHPASARSLSSSPPQVTSCNPDNRHRPPVESAYRQQQPAFPLSAPTGNASRPAEPFDLSSLEAEFNLSDLGYSDTSSQLPSYDEIMNMVNTSRAQPHPDTYSVPFHASSHPMDNPPTPSPSSSEYADGYCAGSYQSVHAGSSSDSGQLEENIWRTFIGDLMGGDI